ncbi:hypothetical protein WMO79_02935 [Micrococcaceae bacterium Sec7.4]
MRWIAGLFVIAHGLVHLAIWLPKPDEKAPFDVGHSPFAGNVRRLASGLAIAATVILALGGLGLIGDASWWIPVTVTGAAISAALLILTFNRWWLIGLGINAAIIVLALQQAG